MIRERIYRITGIVVAAVFVLLLAAVPAAAVPVLDNACQNGGGSDVCQARGDSLIGGGSLFENITNLLFIVIGAVAVIMIIVGGLKYITANGDQSQITGAKNTILYSVIGLILAVAAGGIVNFVLDNL